MNTTRIEPGILLRSPHPLRQPTNGPAVYIGMELSARLKQLDRNDDAALPAAHERGRDQGPGRDFCRSVFPSRVQDACGPRCSSGHIERADVSDALRSWQ